MEGHGCSSPMSYIRIDGLDRRTVTVDLKDFLSAHYGTCYIKNIETIMDSTQDSFHLAMTFGFSNQKSAAKFLLDYDENMLFGRMVSVKFANTHVISATTTDITKSHKMETTLEQHLPSQDYSTDQEQTLRKSSNDVNDIPAAILASGSSYELDTVSDGFANLKDLSKTGLPDASRMPSDVITTERILEDICSDSDMEIVAVSSGDDERNIETPFSISQSSDSKSMKYLAGYQSPSMAQSSNAQYSDGEESARSVRKEYSSIGHASRVAEEDDLLRRSRSPRKEYSSIGHASRVSKEYDLLRRSRSPRKEEYSSIGHASRVAEEDDLPRRSRSPRKEYSSVRQKSPNRYDRRKRSHSRSRDYRERVNYARERKRSRSHSAGYYEDAQERRIVGHQGRRRSPKESRRYGNDSFINRDRGTTRQKENYKFIVVRRSGSSGQYLHVSSPLLFNSVVCFVRICIKYNVFNSKKKKETKSLKCVEIPPQTVHEWESMLLPGGFAYQAKLDCLTETGETLCLESEFIHFQPIRAIDTPTTLECVWRDEFLEVRWSQLPYKVERAQVLFKVKYESKKIPMFVSMHGSSNDIFKAAWEYNRGEVESVQIVFRFMRVWSKQPKKVSLPPIGSAPRAAVSLTWPSMKQYDK